MYLDLLQHLENQINQLSVIDQTLVTLSLEGLNQAEIADIIGITVPNVKTKLHRIKKHLYEQLNGNNNE